MSEREIQIMNLPLCIVTAMARDTTFLMAMASLAPVALAVGGVGVLNSPVRRMNISQRDAAFVAEYASVRSLGAIVTGHTIGHYGIVFFRRLTAVLH